MLWKKKTQKKTILPLLVKAKADVRTAVQVLSFLLIFLIVLINILFIRRSLYVLKIKRAIFEKLGVSLALGVIISLVLSGIVTVICGMILAFVICLFKKNDNKLLDNVD